MPTNPESSEPVEVRYRVAVKAFCQFTAKSGDLDRRFTPAPTARQGMAGHALIAAGRGGDYRAELTLKSEHGALIVRGRADGFVPAETRLEEFKTHRGPVDRVPGNHRALHWAQLQTYGAMLAERDGLDVVTLALVYLDIDSQRQTVLEENWPASKLVELFRHRCDVFARWADAELLHQGRRNASLRALVFPFGELHAQQRLLAESVYRVAARRGRLLAEAPTGVGKTLGTLFPLLKALSAGKIDRIFYLTAKSTGRALALDAIAQLRRANPAMTLRTLDLVAREKACVHPGSECHAASCPLARGFYDRLAAARAAATELQVMDQPSLRAVALEHEVCPYYLGQEMTRWADVVIADYNHYFDSSAMLHALARDNDWQPGVLVDEAHNLVPRARAMYSARLDEATLQAAYADTPQALRAALRPVVNGWNALRKQLPSSYTVLDQQPEALVLALREVAGRLSEWSALNAEPLPSSVQQFHFFAMDFLRLADTLGPDSLLEWNGDPAPALGIRNVVPAAFLAPRFAAARTLVLFSATVSPRAYYEDMLGLRDNCAWLQVSSPFQADQLRVNVVADVSTRFRDRLRSLPPIATLVAQQFRSSPGNYLLFASSFEYLRQVESQLRASYPDIPLWSQTAGMTEAQRSAFAGRFVADGAGIGLAVLGGAFGEGIDLPGTRLVGAFVLTLGLPAVDAANEETRKRLQQTGGRGYEYTYLYPGLQRVVQAAGRVIRSTADRGWLYLIDERYALPAIAELLPSWWVVRRINANARLERDQ